MLTRMTRPPAVPTALDDESGTAGGLPSRPWCFPECEFVNVDHGEDGIKCFAIHPGGVATELGRNMPEELHPYLTDSPDLAAGFVVWLASGKADWAKGRYLSANWDVEELISRKDEIVRDDLLVNRLRTKA